MCRGSLKLRFSNNKLFTELVKYRSYPVRDIKLAQKIKGSLIYSSSSRLFASILYSFRIYLCPGKATGGKNTHPFFHTSIWQPTGSRTRNRLFLAAFLFFLAEIIAGTQGFSIAHRRIQKTRFFTISPWQPALAALSLSTGIFDHEITVLELELSRLATRDPLTQILNRRQLFLLLEKQFDLSRRYNSVFSTILIDIDFFKKINDTFGHKCGDEALIWISKKNSKELTKPGYISLGMAGRSFALYFLKRREKSAFSVSEKLRAVIEKQPFRSKAGSYHDHHSFLWRMHNFI